MAPGVDAIAVESYSQNGLCLENNCVNPVFPGLNDLDRLSALQWQCSSYTSIHPYLRFCKDAIDYDPALPSPNSTVGSVPIDELIRAQDNAAATMYFYHLSGMGYDAWTYPEPEHVNNDCVQSVWRMVCYTYFPRSEAGCQSNQETPYKRPCMNACQSYVSACAVECCDESVQCVFQHQVDLGRGESLIQTGYVDALGPSATCTGGATRGAPLLLVILGVLGLHFGSSECASSAERHDTSSTRSHKSASSPRQQSSFAKPLLIALVALMSFALQGCDVEVPRHSVGNWRQKTDYLQQFEFVPAGGGQNAAVLNSCADPNVPATQQCSGHGYCKPWFKNPVSQNWLAFCHCDTLWADPECKTQRKSQIVAYCLSLFFGLLGADLFYLGYTLWGLLKLVTFGGCGFWWLVDIVRIGSGPVYSKDQFALANDLPHWVYAVTCISFFLMMGFIVSIWMYLEFRKRKREDYAQMQRDEEERHFKNTEEELMGPRFSVKGMDKSFSGARGFSGYGATIPQPLPNAGEPFQNFAPAGAYA